MKGGITMKSNWKHVCGIVVAIATYLSMNTFAAIAAQKALNWWTDGEIGD